MSATRALSASLEDYLEAILHVTSEKQVARAKDISTRLRVTNSSVTGALRALAERGLVNYAPYDLITLTAEGLRAARDITRRHEVLRDFFIEVLNVNPATADEGACKMGHEIPDEVLDRFIRFVEFVEACPRAGAGWVQNFGSSCHRSADLDKCVRCINSCMAQVEDKSKGRIKKATRTLNELAIGDHAKIMKITGRGQLRQDLVNRGLVPGAILAVERIAPSGDLIDIKVRGYHLSLRRSEAALVVVATLGVWGKVCRPRVWP